LVVCSEIFERLLDFFLVQKPDIHNGRPFVERVTGCMMIVSHLNAHTENGMEWLDNVVVPGLAKISTKCKWIIEVHGNEEEVTSGKEDEEETASEEGPGPAVYIFHKKKIVDASSTSNDPPNAVSVKFFSY
jgi:hypothetical protein